MANDEVSVASPEDVRLDARTIDQEQSLTKSTESSFTEVSLGEKRKKAPRQILHFSDGILEEYSTDEEDAVAEMDDKKPLIDPSTLAWIPYMWYLTLCLGSKALAVCDYLGEHLAYFFGITSPKYQYEIEEYKRLVEEEEAEKKAISEDNVGWPSKTDIITLKEIHIHEPVKAEVGLKAIPSVQQTVTMTSDSQNWERY